MSHCRHGKCLLTAGQVLEACPVSHCALLSFVYFRLMQGFHFRISISQRWTNVGVLHEMRSAWLGAERARYCSSNVSLYLYCWHWL